MCRKVASAILRVPEMPNSLLKTTGPTILPDVGTLSYNSVTFSALYSSKFRGTPIPDDSKRTTKAVTWKLTVTGYVTLNAGAQSTDDQIRFMRNRLETPGGWLIYNGNGLGGLEVNRPGGTLTDLSWGPIPKVIAFQPLGGGLGAFVEWEVETTIPQFASSTLPLSPVMQFNYDVTISYDEMDYSTLSIRGTLEIGLTRRSVNDHTVQNTVDAYRALWLDIRIDLTKFRIVKRNFPESRDNKTIEWEFVAEELPPMGLPPGATDARGTMAVRPAKVGAGASVILTGMCWGVTLQCTYAIRKDFPRRQAFLAFLSLLNFRLRSAVAGFLPDLAANNAEQQRTSATQRAFRLLLGALPAVLGNNGNAQIRNEYAQFRAASAASGAVQGQGGAFAVMTDFNFREGIHLESKTITFEASWLLLTNQRTILVATGVWRWEKNTIGGNEWATSVQDISGWKSWLANSPDTAPAVIVDLSGDNLPRTRRGDQAGVLNQE